MLGRCKFPHVRYVLAHRQIRPFVVDRNIRHFLWYGGFAGEGLRSVREEALPSSKSICSILPIARHLQAGAPRWDSGLYNAPGRAHPLPARPFALPRPDALSPSPLHFPQRAHNTRRYGLPSWGAPGLIGVARSGFLCTSRDGRGGSGVHKTGQPGPFVAGLIRLSVYLSSTARGCGRPCGVAALRRASGGRGAAFYAGSCKYTSENLPSTHSGE